MLDWRIGTDGWTFAGRGFIPISGRDGNGKVLL